MKKRSQFDQHEPKIGYARGRNKIQDQQLATTGE